MAAAERLRGAQLTGPGFESTDGEAPASLTGRRILLVLPSLLIGGSERQATSLARWLRDRCGARVAVWGFGAPGPIADRLAEDGIPWRAIAFGWPASRWMRAKALLRLTRELRRFRPDVLLPYTVRPNVACGLTWRLTGARACLWGQRDEGRDLRVERGWQRWAARLTPRFIANSEHGRRFLIESLGVAERRARVIPNGVELPAPRLDPAGWRRRLGLGETTPVALMVANLHRYKDHGTLLEAWRRVLDGYGGSASPPVLLLAGRPGDTEPAVRAHAAELGIGDAVRLLGPMDDVAGLLGAADLLVFSSRYEGCPNAVLEAMSAGLAVAATDSPGVREALGQDAPLAPAGDAGALAGIVSGLLRDPARRRELGAANRRRAAERFAPERSFRLFAEEVAAAMARGDRPAPAPNAVGEGVEQA